MSTVLQIYEAIDRLAPFSLSMDFDNTGILVGDRQKKVERALLALDCTKEVLRQAKELGAQLMITHHPIIFHPIKRVNEDSLVYHLLRSDIAVISLSGVVESASIKVAGDQFNESIVKYMRRKHNILIGERTAEQMKMEIGCVYPREEEATIEIKGRCLMTGLPKTITVNSTEMMEAFEEPVERILEAVHNVLERTPPELVADISNNGIVMTGGGSLVDGFDKLITARTGIHTVVAEDAISCVAEGTGKSLDSLGDMQDGTVNLSRRRQMN